MARRACPPSPYLDRTGLEQGPAIGTWCPGHTSIAAGELCHCDVEGGCRQCCGQGMRVSALDFSAREG